MFYKKLFLLEEPVAEKVLRSLSYIACICLLLSCAKIGLYEKSKRIPDQAWDYSNTPGFTFDVPDTAVLYNLYIVLRHTDAYRYNNIWLNLGTKFPGDTIRYQRFELQLGSDATGWEGTGMDDIWEVRKPVTKGPVKFSKAGNYTFTLAQAMRENPLQHIMNAGIRVQRVR